MIVDHLTSWTIAKAIPNKEVTSVANAIFDKLILKDGAPEICLYDNSKEFTTDTLAYVCQELNIDQHFTSPYTPRSNGKTENFYKFLKASLRKLCQEDTASWDQVLTRSYLHTGVAHILLPVRDLIHYSITETHLYLYKN